MVWHGMVWCGTVWYGMVWYGMVWYGMVWCGVVWYGMVWYGMVNHIISLDKPQIGVFYHSHLTVYVAMINSCTERHLQ